MAIVADDVVQIPAVEMSLRKITEPTQTDAGPVIL
jgi:hypothetical protein